MADESHIWPNVQSNLPVGHPQPGLGHMGRPTRSPSRICSSLLAMLAMVSVASQVARHARSVLARAGGSSGVQKPGSSNAAGTDHVTMYPYLSARLIMGREPVWREPREQLTKREAELGSWAPSERFWYSRPAPVPRHGWKACAEVLSISYEGAWAI